MRHDLQGSEHQRVALLESSHRAGGGKICLRDFSLPGEALTGLEDPSWTWELKSFKERRSPGWRREDLSRGFLAPRRGAHRAGGNKIRLGPGN